MLRVSKEGGRKKLVLDPQVNWKNTRADIVFEPLKKGKSKTFPFKVEESSNEPDAGCSVDTYKRTINGTAVITRVK